MANRQGKANWVERKRKSAEPNLRDKLSQNFVRALEADFSENGVEAIKALREKSPEKYCEISARLIAAIDSKPDGFSQCETMEDIGRKLLQSVGTPDGEITSEMCVEAVAANDSLVAQLEAIRDKAFLAAAVEGELN